MNDLRYLSGPSLLSGGGSVSPLHFYREISYNCSEVQGIPQHWVFHTRPPNSVDNNSLDNEKKKEKFFSSHNRKGDTFQVSNNLYD